MSSEIADRIAVAKMVAYDAGKLLMKYWGHLDSYQKKDSTDLVTEADRAAEALIHDKVASRFPQDEFFGEEGGLDRNCGGFRWVVDPLDGTTNFVHGVPLFAVSVGIEADCKGVAGVVYLPATRELFFASSGQGAFGPSGKLCVSKTSRFGDALLCTGIPYRGKDMLEVLLEDWRRAVTHGQGLRRQGSAATDLAYVAAGRFELFFERELKPWDTAAGAVIVAEAGGRLSDFSGQPFSPYKGEILASNGLLHEQALEMLFGGRK